MEFLKNIPPFITLIIGTLVLKVSKFLEGIATLFIALSVSLHIVLETKEGKKLKELEKATQSILNMYANLTKRVEAQRHAVSEEENKLAKILKKEENVIPLEKKKNDNNTTTEN